MWFRINYVVKEKIKKGFDKLKGIAAISAMGIGLLATGSGRAATVSLPLTLH